MNKQDKTIKCSIQDLIQQLEQLQAVVNQKHQIVDVTSFDHFTEIRRQIDIFREELKAKIDKIALQLIEQTKEKEKTYASKLKHSISNVVDTDIAQISQLVAQEFRRPNLQIEEVKCLQDEHAHKVKEFKARIDEVDCIGNEIKSLMFKIGHGFRDESFGLLKSNGLIACAFDCNIKIWNLAFNECVATLEGHEDTIICLETIDENRFASGSDDTTIRIWDVKKFVCLQTLICNEGGVETLKSLTSNRLASSSYDEIKI